MNAVLMCSCCLLARLTLLACFPFPATPHYSSFFTPLPPQHQKGKCIPTTQQIVRKEGEKVEPKKDRRHKQRQEQRMKGDFEIMDALTLKIRSFPFHFM